MLRILGVSGSLREGSFNASLLRAAVEAAPDAVELEPWQGIGELPLYDEDVDGDDAPAAVRRLREDWAAADAILFVTPEYNGSVPGGLKNAVDWASRPPLEAVLRNKPVAVVGASTGQFGALWAQQDLKRVLGIAGARVVGTEIPVARAHERFDRDGRLLDGELFEQLRLHLTTLAAKAAVAPEEKRRGAARSGPSIRSPARSGRGALLPGPRSAAAGRRGTRRPPRWLGGSP